MTDTVTNSAGSSKDNSTPLAKFLARFFKQKAAPTGSYYGEPGAGDSRVIAVVTVVSIIALWTFVTEAGLIKPLFLPSPIDVIARIGDLFQDGFSGATLLQHMAASFGRIFGSFFLACITGIPLALPLAAAG